MRALLTAALSFVLALAPAVGGAAENTCRTVSVTVSSAAFTTVDISGGAVSSDAFPASTSLASGATVPRFTYLMIKVTLTDANDSISNVRLTTTAAETSTGTFGATPLCIDVAPGLTCGSRYVDWDPQTHGKTFWIKPWDWGYLYGKLTLTPTGHGAGDTATVVIKGCWE